MHFSFCPKARFVFCCLCWVLGLLLGAVSAAHADTALVSLMRSGALHRVSIVLLLMWCVLPFLFTAWSVMIQRFEFLLLLVFCRCFFSGFLLWLEVRAFGSAAWLMVPLSRFSDLLTLTVFCWYTLACLNRSGKREFLICLLITAAVIIIDFFAVMPFMAQL